MLSVLFLQHLAHTNIDAWWSDSSRQECLVLVSDSCADVHILGPRRSLLFLLQTLLFFLARLKFSSRSVLPAGSYTSNQCFVKQTAGLKSGSRSVQAAKKQLQSAEEALLQAKSKSSEVRESLLGAVFFPRCTGPCTRDEALSVWCLVL